MIVGLMVAGGGVLHAQTGPGGVEDTTGSSDLQIWMKGNDGISPTTDGNTITEWRNLAGGQSTNPSVAGDPIYQSDVLNGNPIVRFDGTDDQFDFSNDFGFGGNNTLIVVSKNSGELFQTYNQTPIGFGDFPADGAPNGRGLAYSLDVQTGGDQILVAAISGDAKASQGNGNGNGQGNQPSQIAESTSYNVTPFSIYSSIAEPGGSDSQDLRANGALLNTGPANDVSGELPRIGERLVGDIAEVIAINKKLNAAELTILYNYLSKKYDIDLEGSDIADIYGFNSYIGDLAGIGRAGKFGSGPVVETGGQRAARSDILELAVADAGSFFAKDEFVTFGHNEKDRSFSTSDRPNDDANSERLKRVWRADLTGADIDDPSTIETVRVDTSALFLGSSYNDYALFVSSNDDFSGGATFYPLAQNGGLLEATNVDIGDGDHITVARINRTVTFKTTNGSKFEDTNDTPNAEVTAVLNYEASSDVEFAFSDTGNIDGTGGIEDGGTTNNAGSNDDGDFEADDGSGNDTDGDFDGDYRVSTGSPLTITGGSTESDPIEIELDEDNIEEQTEKFAITIDDITAGNASVGSADTFTFSIFDDDQPRKVKFADPNYIDDDTDPNFDPDSNEGDPSDNDGSRTESFTVKLREDGEGETATTGSPYTTVDFSVDAENTDANFGTDLTDPVVDVRIKDESGSAGEEYQERLSETSGRIHLGSGTSFAPLRLEINEDAVEDAGGEKIDLDLKSPISSALAPDSTSLTFEIIDDDGEPEVAFSSGSFSGDESEEGLVEVELKGGAVGTDIKVEFTDNTSSKNSSDTDDVAETGDYDDSATKNAIITIPEGSATETLPFDVTDGPNDGGEEKNEKVYLSINGSNSAATEAVVDTLSSTTYTILDNDGVGAVGPGGVGNESSLQVWLKGDEGVNASGGNVSEWVDQSGNGNDATQSDTDPRPTTGTINNRPSVTFDGTDDFLRTDIASLPSGPNTVFAVSSANTAGAALGIEDGEPNSNGDFTSLRTLEYTDGSTAEASQNGTATDNDVGAGGAAILSSIYDGAELDIQADGGAATATTSTDPDISTDGTYAFLGAEVQNDGDQQQPIPVAANPFDGNLGEFIVYERALNTAQRRIVANYLAAKYGLSGSLVNDYYAGDTGAGFDQNVIGVGAEGSTAGTQHNRAEGVAVRLSINSFSTGNYVFVGDTTYASANDINVQDASGVTGVTARSDHLRYIDTKGQPTFNITIDLDKLGLQGPAGTASNYRLLYRSSSGSGEWSTPKTVGGRSTSGSQVTFSGVQFGSGGQQAYITIGTTNQVASPLDTRLTTIRGSAGKDGNDKGWRYYGPPGSRDSGPVQMGEIRLRTPNGKLQTVDFRVNMSYTWSRGSGSGSGGDWLAASASTNVPVGRGAILFLYDDKYYPLDPELTIDPEESGTNGSFSYTGDTDITVGDQSPGADSTLGEDVNSHLLANPYETTYDLGSLQTLNQDGDGDGTNDWATAVQVWDTLDEDPDSEDPRGTYKVRSTDPAKPEADRLISPGQAFFLERNDTTDDGGGLKEQITFSADGRQDNQNVDFVGTKKATSAASTRRAGQIKLRLQVHNSEGDLVARDRAASLYFREGADSTWDAFDAPKLVPWDQSYATIAFKGTKPGGESALKAQESRPYQLDETIELPLELTAEGVAGKATLSAPAWWEIPADWTLTLVDTKGTEDTSDDVEHDLRRDGQNPYRFSVDSTKQMTQKATSKQQDTSAPTPPSTLKQGDTSLSKSAAKSSSTDSRFRLKVNPGVEALPVELANMKAQTNGQSVLLQWSTSSETNNAGFYVEHRRLGDDSTTSATSAAWTRTGFVDGSGTTDAPQDYRHEISGLDYGQYAFRLRQVDTDGSETTSDVVNAEIRLDGSHSVSAPYPNPVRRQATLEVTVREDQPVRVELYDVLGRRVRTVYDETVSGQETQRVQIDADDLSSGHYFLRVQGDGFAETQRMTVVR